MSAPNPEVLPFTTHYEDSSVNKTEQTLIIALQARERELFREFIQPLQDAYKKVTTDIETRLNLPVGSIGTTHTLDQVSWKVTPVPVTVPPEEKGEVDK